MKRIYASPSLLCITTVLLMLAGCKSTMDLNPQDDSAPTFLVGAEKRLTERVALRGQYSIVHGRSNETFGNEEAEAIQVDAHRFTGNPDNPLLINYNFDFNTFIFEASMDIIKGPFYTLKIAPGISWFNYDLDVTVNNNSLSTSDSELGMGATLENQFSLSDDLTVNFALSIYDNDDVGKLYRAFAEIRYLLDDNWALILGYRGLSLKNAMVRRTMMIIASLMMQLISVKIQRYPSVPMVLH